MYSYIMLSSFDCLCKKRNTSFSSIYRITLPNTCFFCILIFCL